MRNIINKTYEHVLRLRHLIFRRYSGAAMDNDLGYTRSIYCKPKLERVIRDGKPIEIFTGLVDDSNESLGDQFVRLQMKLTYKHNLDFESLLKWARHRVKERNRVRQILSKEHIEQLGLDLAVAHMVCKIGGRVQWLGSDDWIHDYAGIPARLPTTFSDLKLKAIDLSGTCVVYEGFEYLPYLSELRVLRLRRCVHVDDFCLSRVGRITTLQLLDVSECPRLTSKGLATLTQLKNLRRLVVSGNPTMENKELVCLLLEDHLPKLYIHGVDYVGRLPDDSKQKILALEGGDAAKIQETEKKTHELLMEAKNV